MDRFVFDSVGHNWLVEAFPPGSRRRLARHFQLVQLNFKDVICEAGGFLTHVYFPYDAVISLMTLLEEGLAIETAVIGREGMLGSLTFPSAVSSNRCKVQLAGRALICPFDVLETEIGRSEGVRCVLGTYSGALLAQVQQTSGCNASHSVEQRMSRVLLLMDDRAEGRPLPFTHEFLSTILGANRKSITMAAQVLQNAGGISYGRGSIQLMDRTRLEATACGCYANDRKRFQALRSETVKV